MPSCPQDSKHSHFLVFNLHHFTDDNAKFPSLKLGHIPFNPDAGLYKPQASFNKFVKGSRTAPAKVQVVDYRE